MRYIILLILNAPVLLLAFTNLLVQFKLKKITPKLFYQQLGVWFVISTVLVCSFPVYNSLTNKPLLDSASFTAFDIVQTTAIVYLLYVINDHRRKIERTEKTLRDLHQELSIKLRDNQ
jgi:hypothetical protein